MDFIYIFWVEHIEGGAEWDYTQQWMVDLENITQFLAICNGYDVVFPSLPNSQ